MYEALSAPLPDTGAYLERLGLSDIPVADKSHLDQLIYAQHCQVPFENLDVYDLHLPVSLEIPALFDKIVTRKRGGYCFELNALFYTLLQECGYSVTPCLARILRNKDYMPPILHRGNIINLQGQRYFSDVGYGGPMPAGPIPLLDGYEEDIHGQVFRMDQQDEYWWKVSYYSHGALIPVLSFSVTPQQQVDFVSINYYCSTHPDSVFRNKRFVNLRTDTGSLAISENIFTRVENGMKTETALETDAQLHQTLSEWFHLNI